MPTYNFLGLEIWLPDLSDLVNVIVTPVRDFITSGLTGLWNLISPAFDVIGSTIASAVTSIVTSVTDFVRDPLGSIQTVLGDAWAGVQALGGALSTGLDTVTSTVWSGLQGLWTQVETGLGTLSADVGAGLNGLAFSFTTALDGAGRAIGSVVEGIPGAFGQVFSPIFSGFGVIDPKSTADGIGQLAGVLARDLSPVVASSSPITLEDAKHRAETIIEANEVSWQRFDLMCLVAEVASLGQVDVNVSNLMKMPQVDAWYRLAADLEYMKFDVGIKKTYEYHLNSLWQANIPGYGDMIDVYVREGYLPEKWAELPPEFVAYMKWLGYDEFWTQRLWGKHWVLVPLTQLYDMFHRKIIDQATLETQLKYHDYEAVWRPRLVELSYELIPRVDLRRGWEAGLITDEDLVRRYEFLGFSPEDAELQAGLQKRFVLASEFGAMSSEAIKDYVDGFIDEATLRANLGALGFHAAVIDMRVEAAKLRAEREYKAEEKALLETLHGKDLISKEDLANGLTKLGYRPEYVNLFVDRATVKKARVTELETAALAKPLSLTVVTRAWTKGLISEPEAVERLMLLGYSEPDARLILDVYRPEEETE